MNGILLVRMTWMINVWLKRELHEPACFFLPRDRVWGCLSLFHTAGTERVQFGYTYAETACKERSELYGDFGTK